jgi:hypothetical protein
MRAPERVCAQVALGEAAHGILEKLLVFRQVEVHQVSSRGGTRRWPAPTM